MRKLIFCAVLFCLSGISLSTLAAAPVTVQVSIRNLAPAKGTFLTPFWVGFHDGAFDLYDLGSPASTAIERVAEDGDTSVLMADFAAGGSGSVQATIMGPTMPPIAPGQTASMFFVLDSAAMTSRYFSYASMVIPSNDAFIANGDPIAIPVFDSMSMFVGGTFVVMGSMVRDAGTEVNDEVPMNTAFFGQTMPNTGVTEGGVIMMHPGFLPPGSGGILESAMFANADFRAAGYEMAEISIQAVPEPSTVALLAGGLAAMAWVQRRRKAKV